MTETGSVKRNAARLALQVFQGGGAPRAFLDNWANLVAFQRHLF